jgi:opacity protein-like surface antigen
MIRGVIAAVTVATLASASTADARPASQGWYAEGGLGAVTFLPATSRQAAVGPAVGFRIGRDLFSFLSLGIQIGASSHEATVPAPPEGEWFQLYRSSADLRLGGRIGRIALFVEGGAGAAMISSNILGKMDVEITEPDEEFTLMFQAGAGLEYQLENRHYAIGLAGDWFFLPQFKPPNGAPMQAIDSRLYLRYTY